MEFLEHFFGDVILLTLLVVIGIVALLYFMAWILIKSLEHKNDDDTTKN